MIWFILPLLLGSIVGSTVVEGGGVGSVVNR